MIRQLLAFTAVALLALIACTTPTVLTPTTGPGTEWPCGLHCVVCADGTWCYEGEVCGGQPFSGCRAGECCFVGEDGARRSHPASRAR